MHRRRTALRALCGGGVLAARGTAGRKAERCAGCDARYLGAYLRFGRAAWQCGCDMRGSHLRSGGLSRRMWWLRDLRRVALRQAGAPAQAARQSAARNGVGSATWPTRRARYTRHIALRRLSRRMWRLRDLRRAGTQSVRRTGRNRAADNGACQRCACAVCCSAACHCALNCAIDCCL